MVHVKWALVVLIAAGAAYGYAWYTKPNQTPSACIEALDLNQRITAARESVNRPVPSQTLPPDVSKIGQLTTDYQAAEQRCRDAK